MVKSIDEWIRKKEKEVSDKREGRKEGGRRRKEDEGREGRRSN